MVVVTPVPVIGKSVKDPVSRVVDFCTPTVSLNFPVAPSLVSYGVPTYQFLLHTTDINLDMGDGEAPTIGFYTSRRATAPNSEEAYKIVMEAMDVDPDLKDIFRSGHDAGLRPRTVTERTCIIPWWRAILPWRKAGLKFYSYEPDEDDGDASA